MHAPPAVRRHVLTLLVLGLAAAPLAAADGDGLGPDGVLSFFQDLVHAAMAPHENPRDLVRIRLERRDVEESASRRLVSALPPGCGMVELEPLPRDAALRRLRTLFGLYGFPQRADHQVAEAGVEARLDGYDPASRTGFVLVRGAFAPHGRSDPVLRERPPIPPEVELDLEEWRTLSRGGARILRVPEDRFVGLPPDAFLPLLHCLLSAADWLNGVAEGADFDVEALVAAPRTARVEDLDPQGLHLVQPIQQDENGVFVVARAAAPTTLRIPPFIGQRPSRRGPALLVLPFSWLPPWQPQGYDFGEARLSFELRQHAGDAAPLRVVSKRPVFLLPPEFEPERAFEVRLVLPKGQTTLSREATLFAAP